MSSAKKPQKCTFCKKEGHNKAKCPGVDGTFTNNVLDVEYILSHQKPIRKDHYDNQRGHLKDIEKMELSKLIDDNKRYIGENYFFRNILDTVAEIQTVLIEKPNVKFIHVVAEPGAGKTDIMDCISYMLKTHSDNPRCLLGDRISLLTGMNSVESKDDLETKLKFVKDYYTDFKVYHNPSIYKRIDYLIENPLLLLNHYFIIDESHIACQAENTLAKEFKRLGLNKENIAKLNIKFILVSATPDILLKEIVEVYEEDYDVKYMKPGPNYRGSRHFNIIDYNSLDEKVNREILIENVKEYPNAKYHFIRVKSAKFANKLRAELNNEGFLVYDYDQVSNKNLKKPLHETIKIKPNNHTFYFIKDMYRASKRLRLNPNIGIIIEPFNKDDYTVTGQGLIPRWFTYYTEGELENCNPIFIGNKKAFDKIKLFYETKRADHWKSRLTNKKNTKTYQIDLINRDPNKKKVYTDSDLFDELSDKSLDDLESEMESIFETLPSNTGLGSIKKNTLGLFISTTYCERIDKNKTTVDPDNYTPITESKLFSTTRLGKNLGKGESDRKLIFIPYYNDSLEPDSLMWCCRYLKPRSTEDQGNI